MGYLSVNKDTTIKDWCKDKFLTNSNMADLPFDENESLKFQFLRDQCLLTL